MHSIKNMQSAERGEKLGIIACFEMPTASSELKPIRKLDAASAIPQFVAWASMRM